jgi:hypothetical protein
MPPRKAKRRENPYGKGKPVDEKVVLEGMKIYEKELNSKFDELHQQFVQRYMLEEKFRNKFLDGLKKVGVDFTEEIEQMKQEASKFKPGAAPGGKHGERSSPFGDRF